MKLPAFLSRLLPVRAKAAVSPLSWNDMGGFWGAIRESFSGAFQSAITVDAPKELVSYSPVFASATLIANDIAKLGVGLVMEDDSGVCTPAPKTSPFWRVLRKPNHYQNWIKFIEHWVLSKLLWGNTYIVKERDSRGVVAALYILDPQRTRPLVTPTGDVYYELAVDNLSGVQERTVVAASEVIHDRMNCLWHPLVGVSPLYAAGMSATLGNRIQRNSATFFANMSRPGGMLTAPEGISDEVALRLKREFEENFSGDKLGRLLVGGDGLQFNPMSIAADAAQLVEQLNWTAVDVARAFHMPMFKIGGSGDKADATLSIAARQQQYLNDCLQIHIVDIEVCMSQGLEVPAGYSVEIDEEDMLRMDPQAQFEAYGAGVKNAILAPNEARRKFGLADVPGGDAVYLQQQNYSLEALSKRDASPDPFASNKPAPTPDPALPAPTKAMEQDFADFMLNLKSLCEAEAG